MIGTQSPERVSGHDFLKKLWPAMIFSKTYGWTRFSENDKSLEHELGHKLLYWEGLAA